jgi:hypothetical protein
MDLNHQINTIGLESTGEFESRAMRETRTAEDYTNAWVAGAANALTKVAIFAEERILAAGPYDDVRALQELEQWVADKIREVHSKATDGSRNA